MTSKKIELNVGDEEVATEYVTQDLNFIAGKVKRPAVALRFILFLADGPKTREEMVDMFQIDFGEHRYVSQDMKYWRRSQTQNKIEKLEKRFEQIQSSMFDDELMEMTKQYAELSKQDSDKVNKARKEAWKMKNYIAKKSDPFASNISKVAKDLHKRGYIHIVYRHPKHSSPVSESGKLRPGVKVTYVLREQLRHVLGLWMKKCLLVKEGVLRKTIYPRKPFNGEYFREEVECVPGKGSRFPLEDYDEYIVVRKETADDKKGRFYKRLEPLDRDQMIRVYIQRVPDEMRLVEPKEI